MEPEPQVEKTNKSTKSEVVLKILDDKRLEEERMAFVQKQREIQETRDKLLTSAMIFSIGLVAGAAAFYGYRKFHGKGNTDN
jgi:hypothetical protein